MYAQVLAGVIGFHKPQFSLIGDTVNTTSRICAAAEINKPTLSSQAFHQIDEKQYSHFNFHSRTIFVRLLNIDKVKIISFKAKGKGELTIFSLERNQLSGELSLGTSATKRISLVNKNKSFNFMNLTITGSEQEPQQRSNNNKQERSHFSLAPNPILPALPKLMNDVFQGMSLETRKSLRHSLQMIRFEGEIIEEDSDGKIMQNTLRNMGNSKSVFSILHKSKESPKNLDLRPNHSVSFEPSIRVRNEERFMLLQKVQVLAEEGKSEAVELEEVAELFMDEPLGVFALEESKSYAQSKALMSSAAISQGAEAGIKEFNEQNIKNNLLMVNEVLLYFKPETDKNLRQEFLSYKSKKCMRTDQWNIIAFATLKSLILFIAFIAINQYDSIYVFFFLKLALICALLLFFLCYTKFKHWGFKDGIILIYFLFLVETILNEKRNSSNILLSPRLELVAAYLSLSNFSFLHFWQVGLITMVYIASEALWIFNAQKEQDWVVMVFVIGFAAMNLGLLNHRLKLQINLFNEIRNNNFEKAQLNRLIMYLLPPHVKLKFLKNLSPIKIRFWRNSKTRPF